MTVVLVCGGRGMNREELIAFHRAMAEARPTTVVSTRPMSSASTWARVHGVCGVTVDGTPADACDIVRRLAAPTVDCVCLAFPGTSEEMLAQCERHGIPVRRCGGE